MSHNPGVEAKVSRAGLPIDTGARPSARESDVKAGRIAWDNGSMIDHSGSDGRYGGQERRKFARFATQLPAMTLREDLIVRDRTDRAVKCRLDLHDFSLGGLKAESPVRFKLRERLTLRLPPDGTHGPLELTGRVVHCKRQEKTYEVGIEFCQTRCDATTSPWVQLPRFFKVAYEKSPPPPAEQGSSRTRPSL
jgi:hypothetical protein